MSDGILIFTFSPIQSFISESRKLSDLYTSSRILSELSRAVARVLSIKPSRLVYPSDIEGDLPNKLVAILPIQNCEAAANDARKAFFQYWNKIVSESQSKFINMVGQNACDDTWKKIWRRQTAEDYFWEIYWVAVPLNKSYHDNYQEAEKMLGGIKRTRTYQACLEENEKDSLSGSREALHTAYTKHTPNSRSYWSQIVNQLRHEPIVQSGGRECLDAIGVVKRFSKIRSENEASFPSTSTIASQNFIEKVHQKSEAEEILNSYGEILQKMNCPSISKNSGWSFDGDFLYKDTLVQERLEKDYSLENVSDYSIEEANIILSRLYDKTGCKPSSYYGILMLDGDGMGETISGCKTEDEHRAFSEKLNKFSRAIKTIFQEFSATPVYIGGDDVLALAPLEKIIPLAIRLSNEFKEKTGGKTASAGIVISHHRSPLADALRAARSAENTAKLVPGKSAVCVHVLKRGGEEVELLSKWENVDLFFNDWVEYFKSDEISARLAYDLLDEAHTITRLDPEIRQSEIRRLIKRHKKETFSGDIIDISQGLSQWAEQLDKDLYAQDKKQDQRGLVGLGFWLTFARFVASGGVE